MQKPMARDFYSVLDVPSSTSPEEIRQAYLRLARQYHPDISEDPSARERFEEVHQAYVILSDYETRKKFNLYRQGGIEKAAQEASLSDAPLAPLLWWQQLAIFGIVLLGLLGISALFGMMLAPYFF
jgi:DnaJ-class molecular chaperone